MLAHRLGRCCEVSKRNAYISVLATNGHVVYSVRFSVSGSLGHRVGFITSYCRCTTSKLASVTNTVFPTDIVGRVRTHQYRHRKYGCIVTDGISPKDQFCCILVFL